MRRIAWLLLLAFSLVILAGCGSSPPATQQKPPDPPSKTPQQLLDESKAKEAAKQAPKPATTAANYIGNSSSYKFHRTDCGSAVKMSASHRVSFSSREDAIKAGYEPCKQCKP